MLEYDRIDVNKIIDLREYNICHYWYFLKINFRVQPKLYHDFHTLMLKSINFNTVIASVEVNDYRIHFWYGKKDKAINLLTNADLTEKKIKKYNFSLVSKKMDKEIIAFDILIEKLKFHPCKNLILSQDLDIEKI